MGESTSPISVILVSSGSRGNKLLFRFPFQRGAEHPAAQANKPRSRYAVNSSSDTTEDQDGDSRFSDVILATILATKSDMCGKKFELKIDNVRFVGHPTLLQHALGQEKKSFLSIVRGANRLLAAAAWYLEDQTALIQVRSWPQASKDTSVLLWKLSCESTRNVTQDHQDSVLKSLSFFGRQNSSLSKLCEYITSPRQGKR